MKETEDGEREEKLCAGVLVRGRPFHGTFVHAHN